MRKTILLFILFLILFNEEIAGKEYYNSNQMMNTYLKYAEKDSDYLEVGIENFSENIWKERGLLVTKSNENKEKFTGKSLIKNNKKIYYKNRGKTIKSYLGTNINDFLVENPDYPADTKNILQFEEFDWTLNENYHTSLLKKLDVLDEEERRKAQEF